MSKQLIRWMTIAFVIFLILLFIAPKVVQWVAVILAFIPMIALILSVVGLVWYVSASDGTNLQAPKEE